MATLDAPTAVALQLAKQWDDFAEYGGSPPCKEARLVAESLRLRHLVSGDPPDVAFAEAVGEAALGFAS